VQVGDARYQDEHERAGLITWTGVGLAGIVSTLSGAQEVRSPI
jgi:hypothetical protein